jgi:protein-S-isoprenylcysteine O-methyltransferase Ste14
LALVEELESSGQWLFRRRSYLPLVFSGIIFSGLAFFHYPAGSHLLDELWEGVCLLVAFSGVAVRALTIGFTASHTSGRNTGEQVANSLNTTGMYSTVRNPLYLGNFLIILGVVLFLRIWWIPALYAALFALYYERIIFAEEMFLRSKFGQDYLAWASKTPAFFPKFALWKHPVASFSWKKVVRREYHGVMGLVMFLFLLEVASDLAVGERFEIDLLWRYLLGFTCAGYIAVRVLHKHTSWLK